jgi:hypothetical protein
MQINAAIIYNKLGNHSNCHYGLFVETDKEEYIFTFTIHASKNNTHIEFTNQEKCISTTALKSNQISNFIFTNFTEMNKNDKITYLRLLELNPKDVKICKLPVFKTDDIIEQKVVNLITKLR